MENVKKSARASKRGTTIFCPHCKTDYFVIDFNWDTAMCKQCNRWLDKTEFLFDPEIPKLAEQFRTILSELMISELIEKVIQRTPKESIIQKARELAFDVQDYKLVEIFRTHVPTFDKIDENENLAIDFETVKGVASIVAWFYKEEESKDIPELRKQKLLQLQKSSSSAIFTQKSNNQSDLPDGD